MTGRKVSAGAEDSRAAGGRGTGGKVGWGRPAPAPAAPAWFSDWTLTPVETEEELSGGRGLEDLQGGKSRSPSAPGETHREQQRRASALPLSPTRIAGGRGEPQRKPVDGREGTHFTFLNFSQRHEYFKGHSQRERRQQAWVGLSPRDTGSRVQN